MSELPKILVGTLYCGEAEFYESQTSIQQQTGVEISRIVIANMPEYEAHNALWSTWNSCKNNFDMLIKVDADTIIDDRDMFRKMYAEFEKNPRVTGMQIPLKDYFTDDYIFGLNAVRPTVGFKPANDRLHADHSDYGHDIVLRNEAVAHLTPGGRHCANPNDSQSYHYGLHRMLKNQYENIIKTYKAWVKYQDNSRLMAVMGATRALRGKIAVDYSDKEFSMNLSDAVTDVRNKNFEHHLDFFRKRMGL